MMPMNPRMADAEASAYGRMDEMLDGKASQKSVNYRAAGGEDEMMEEGGRCSECISFRAPDACQKVAGKIAPEATCDQYKSSEEDELLEEAPAPEGIM